MKLVVDTNVLLSGSLWAGNTSRLVDALLDGAATLYLSASLLTELEEVIDREKFRVRLAQRGRSAREFIARFRAAAIIVEPASIPVLSILRDPDDVHVLACAAAAGADAIITGDEDLLTMESFDGIPIINPREALRRLGLSSEG